MWYKPLFHQFDNRLSFLSDIVFPSQFHILSLQQFHTLNKINQLISEDSSNNISGFTDLEEFVKSIPKPRKILILVPSGEATNSVVESLFNFIEKKDTLIDGGNAYYLDSIDLGKRCSEQGIEFIGMGISGGETGARTGPALMLGYGKEIPEDLISMISRIAAKADGQECIGLYEGFGTGHFIKMLHNGIEYAEMQLIAEIFEIFYKIF